MNKAIITTIILQLFLTSTSFAQDKGFQFSGFSLYTTSWLSDDPFYSGQGSPGYWQDVGGIFSRELQSPFSEVPSIRRMHFLQHNFDIILDPTNDFLGLPANNQSFSVGMGYAGQYFHIYSTHGKSVTPFDTLSSELGPIYADSVEHEALHVTSYFTKLSLRVQYRLTTSTQKTFQLLVAPTISGDLYFNRFLDGAYRRNTVVKYYNEDLNLYSNQSAFVNPEEDITQRERLPNSVGVTALLPLGISCRLSKTNDWLKKVYLFAVGKPGIQYLIHQDRNNQVNGLFGVDVGIRIENLYAQD